MTIASRSDRAISASTKARVAPIPQSIRIVWPSICNTDEEGEGLPLRNDGPPFVPNNVTALITVGWPP